MLLIPVLLLSGCQSPGRQASASLDARADPSESPALAIRVSVDPLGDAKLSDLLRDNINLFLSVRQLADRRRAGASDRAQRSLTPAAVQRAHQRAPGQIREALAPFGYYEPVIVPKLTRTDGLFRASYQVDPGPATRLREVDVQVFGPAADLPEVRSARAAINLSPGKRLRHARYSEAKQALLNAAYDAGFLDAAYETALLQVDRDARTADVTLHLRSGERYYFGEFELRQDVLLPRFANRFITIEPGTPFDARELVDLQLVLGDTDYFDAVTVTAGRKTAVGQRVPVTIDTTAKKPQQYTAGLGYGTDTGPRGRIGVELRRLNRRGHQFSADLQASAVRNTLAAEYRVPFRNVVEDRYRFFARVDQAEVGDAETDQFSLGVQREETWLGLRRQLYLKYDGENFAFGDAPSQQSRLLIAGAALSYQRADNPLFARKGVSVNLDVHGAEQSLASETTFVQAMLGVNAVWPLGLRGRFLVRGEAGVIEAEDFDRLPPGERFFTGGDRSVRGYAFQTLSPTNAAGDDIGGSHLTVASIEADYLVRGNLGLAVFVDHGGAGQRFGDDLRSGVGIGLRYRSPVGMVRIDLAHPLDDDDNAFRLHLSLGPDL